ncbi:amino acid ABC transporter substrate-binding protein [Chitinimonas sp. PSY-7]|uniref:amino acid ABC transporter substrate-binding protein n=1 Tax=Chitinimonas sp. PSY-7 TaxID=3459088 RepID=UPI00404038C6
MFAKVIAIVLAVMGSAIIQAAEMTEVRYPGDALRYTAYVELLRTALDRTVSKYGAYTMYPTTMEMNEVRYFAEAEIGNNIDVVWGASSIERETKLIPIRIPLEKGLLGYRIGLIRSDQQNKLSEVHTVKDLTQFKFGLGPGWGDIPIYRAAGFPITIAPYEDLFKMVNKAYIDFYSRGVNEIFPEYESMRSELSKLAVEQDLLLYYPYPFYFFVTPKNPKLATRIELGMNMMLADGSFDALFQKYYGSAIELANLGRRRIIQLTNPQLPPGTPLANKRLWFHPGTKGAAK